jgi:hypothetical protein
MRAPGKLSRLLWCMVALIGCRGRSTNAGALASSTATPVPPASSSPAPNRPTPNLESTSLAIGASPVPVTCPPGSSGKGSAHEPCLGKGRWIEAAWTGKLGEPGALFRVKNALDQRIAFETAYVYYYDRSGRPLPIHLPGEAASVPPHESTNTAGEIFQVGPRETKEVYLGVPKRWIPKGTAKVEAEFPRLGFKPDGKDLPLGYWFNDSLIRTDRPLGGHPQ